MGCYLLHVTPLPLPPPSPLPTLRVCRTACGHAIRIRWLRESPPSPPPTLPQEDYEQILATSPKVEDGLHLGVCKYGSWIWTAKVIMYEFSCSDRTLRSRDRIFDFSQEMVKICAGAENQTPTEILIGCASTAGRYSTGETLPIKAERPEPSDHMRSTCLRINTIFEDLNESSSGRLGGSQQLEILPSPNSKRASNFSA